MKNKGLLFILFTLIICFGLFISAKSNPFFIPENPLLGSAQIFALWGMVLFCFTFFLSSRFSFLENIFGSLDKIYKLHQITGRLTLVFLSLHFIFLIINYAGNSRFLPKLILPGTGLPLNLGIFSLWVFLIIISVIIYVRTEYQWFVRIQRLFIIPFALGVGHMLLVSSDSSKYLPLTIFLLILSFAAFASWFYKVFLYTKISPRYPYIVDSLNELTDDILEIILKSAGEKIKFLPGQFVYVEFKNIGIPKELHPFSISSSPTEDKLHFAIKIFGNFTAKIKSVKVGDQAFVFGPYGSFSKRFLDMSDAVCIAGGIGITPFLGMLSYLETDKNLINKKIYLFYSAMNEKGAVYKKELEEKVKSLHNFHFISILDDKEEFLTAQKVSETVEEMKDKLFFLCGPFSMMKDLTKQLTGMGVPLNNIIFEDFNFR